MRALAGVLGALALVLTSTASAHETLYEVRRGTAIAVKVYFADGEALAYKAYEVYSPSDPEIPYQKGRTDREGWVAFVPSGPGKWRVKVVDDTGHGLDVEVDAAPGAVETKAPEGGASVGGVAFALRPLVGLVAIGALFAMLFVFYRRKGVTR